MENASKALIIAGAILLSILIISLGIMIFNQAKGAMDGSQMDQLEMQNFNAKFTQYEGKSVRGSTVNSMLQAVVANNMAQDENSRKVKVLFVDCEGISNDLDEDTATAPKVKTGATYFVDCHIDTTGSDKGLVSAIGVTLKNATNTEQKATFTDSAE